MTFCFWCFLYILFILIFLVLVSQLHISCMKTSQNASWQWAPFEMGGRKENWFEIKTSTLAYPCWIEHLMELKTRRRTSPSQLAKEKMSWTSAPLVRAETGTESLAVSVQYRSINILSAYSKMQEHGEVVARVYVVGKVTWVKGCCQMAMPLDIC